MTYLLASYICGCLVCYFICRSAVYQKNQEKGWAVFERTITMLVSLLSWVSLAILLLFAILCYTGIVNPDKKVKW